MYQENPIISQQWDVCVETVGSFFYNLERSPMEKSQDIITVAAVKDTQFLVVELKPLETVNILPFNTSQRREPIAITKFTNY